MSIFDDLAEELDRYARLSPPVPPTRAAEESQQLKDQRRLAEGFLRLYQQHQEAQQPPTRELFDQLVTERALTGNWVYLRWWEGMPHPCWWDGTEEIQLTTIEQLRAACQLVGKGKPQTQATGD